MAIRYDKKLNTEINRIIRNFNQKVARLEKEERELLPSKITKKELKENVFTRRELRRKLNELERFSTRGAEEVITTSGGVKLTRYELENLKRENRRVRRNITREITRLKTEAPKVFGKRQTATFSMMGDTQYLNLLARKKALEKDITKLDKESYQRFKKLVYKTGKNQVYMNTVFKDNYFEMLTDLAYYFNYDDTKLEYLKDKLMELEPNDFLRLFKDDKSIKAILDYYPIISKNATSINPSDIESDVTGLYDNLIDNIDEILKDYK